MSERIACFGGGGQGAHLRCLANGGWRGAMRDTEWCPYGLRVWTRLLRYLPQVLLWIVRQIFWSSSFVPPPLWYQMTGYSIRLPRRLCVWIPKRWKKSEKMRGKRCLFSISTCLMRIGWLGLSKFHRCRTLVSMLAKMFVKVGWRTARLRFLLLSLPIAISSNVCFCWNGWSE